MDGFVLNGVFWRVRKVNKSNRTLIDRTGNIRLATTDPSTHTIYLCDDLEGELLVTVLVHEIGHCALISYDLLDELHRMVKPRYWIEAEEWVCNFIADYGMAIFRSAEKVLGAEAITHVPAAIGRLIA